MAAVEDEHTEKGMDGEEEEEVGMDEKRTRRKKKVQGVNEVR